MTRRTANAIDWLVAAAATCAIAATVLWLGYSVGCAL